MEEFRSAKKILVSAIFLLSCGLFGCTLSTVRQGYPSDYVYKGDLRGLKVTLTKGHSINTRDPYTQNYTPLMIAAREGEIAIAEFLIKNGADVNAKTRDGHTALMMAAYNRNPEFVELLLRNGAKVNVRSIQGHTAYSEVTLDDSVRVKELLSTFGAKSR
ncbi:ankyrin repeat domain-containing protein [Leptospira semungkisensis]|uniref:Ankyrin repeat domain-containing protein n=1 Tax=Leptospira semungkisensis TaxID=2484985 RepID=A0A4R9G919_9LEPT|nr:ankyrin repeat domain-containing protein [Leptospira semungkisensis]